MKNSLCVQHPQNLPSSEISSYPHPAHPSLPEPWNSVTIHVTFVKICPKNTENSIASQRPRHFTLAKKLYKSPVVFPGLNLESKSHGATIPSKASTQCIPFRVHFAIACTILMTCERLITLSDSCNYNIKTCWAARMELVESKNPYSHRKGLKFVDAPRLTLMRSNKTIDRYKRFIL